MGIHQRMNALASGQLRKMMSELTVPVSYAVPIGDASVAMNELLGKKISLEYSGAISCIGCGRKTRKSFSQGYCYPCFRGKAACDLCILKPETCHFAAGTCREPDWGADNCNIEHVVYLANSSGLKVGITRHSQIPTRWIDQGASQALPIYRVSTRHQSGIVEVLFKEHVADATRWQRMLKGPAEEIDLVERRDELLALVTDGLDGFVERFGHTDLTLLDDSEVVEIEYPVLKYPQKVTSLNFDKTPLVEGTLTGIKGQYLLLDTGVINLRKFGGYHISLTLGD